jgi:hypothetical protein
MARLSIHYCKSKIAYDEQEAGVKPAFCIPEPNTWYRACVGYDGELGAGSRAAACFIRRKPDRMFVRLCEIWHYMAFEFQLADVLFNPRTCLPRLCRGKHAAARRCRMLTVFGITQIIISGYLVISRDLINSEIRYRVIAPLRAFSGAERTGVNSPIFDLVTRPAGGQRSQNRSAGPMPLRKFTK